MSSSRRSLALALAAATGITASALIQDAAPPAPPSLAQAVGGLGMAGALSPEWGFFPVDPRVEAACECELWPVPGGVCYSPWHGAAATDFEVR